MQWAPRWAVLLAAGVVIALVVIFLYVSLARRREAFDQQPWSTFVFLHMTGCGWCERFKPVWADFVSTYNGALTAAHVRAVDVEASSPEMAQYREHVTGYPTLLFVDGDGKVVKFNGDRTKVGLVQFLRDQGVVLKEGFVPTRPTSGSETIGANAATAIKQNKPSDGAMQNQVSQAGFTSSPPPANYTPKPI